MPKRYEDDDMVAPRTQRCEDPTELAHRRRKEEEREQREATAQWKVRQLQRQNETPEERAIRLAGLYHILDGLPEPLRRGLQALRAKREREKQEEKI